MDQPPSPRTHLIIGDAHAKPGVSNERFTWLGRMVVDFKPDVVIDLGDWADMPSLSKYDKFKRSGEGRRISDDIAAAREARQLFIAELDNYNERQRRNHKPLYQPHLCSLTGNHEARVETATNEDPSLYGTIAIEDLGAEEFGWKRIPFLEPVVIDGVCYSHYHTTGVLCKPVSGLHPAATLIRLGHVSSVQGHTHIFDYSERTSADGRRLFGLVAGCFFDHWEDWAGPANQLYWRGLVLIREVVDGYGELTKVSMEQIRRQYG